MPSRDYGALSRIAREADLDVDECGRAAAYMCTPYANLGQSPRRPFVLQLEAARLGGPGSPQVASEVLLYIIGS